MYIRAFKTHDEGHDELFFNGLQNYFKRSSEKSFSENNRKIADIKYNNVQNPRRKANYESSFFTA